MVIVARLLCLEDRAPGRVALVGSEVGGDQSLEPLPFLIGAELVAGKDFGLALATKLDE